MTRLGIIVSGLLIVAILLLYLENQRISDQYKQQLLSAQEIPKEEPKSQGKADSLAFYLPKIYELSRKIHRGIEIDSVYVTIRYDSTLLHSVRIDQMPLAPEADRMSHSDIYH